MYRTVLYSNVCLVELITRLEERVRAHANVKASRAVPPVRCEGIRVLEFEFKFESEWLIMRKCFD